MRAIIICVDDFALFPQWARGEMIFSGTPIVIAIISRFCGAEMESSLALIRVQLAASLNPRSSSSLLIKARATFAFYLYAATLDLSHD